MRIKKYQSAAWATLLLSLITAVAPCTATAIPSNTEKPGEIVFYGKGRIKSGDEQSYALVRHNGTSMIISGNGEQVPVDELRRAIRGDFVWFRDGGQGYVIQDAALLERANRAWNPYEALDESLSILKDDLRRCKKLLAKSSGADDKKRVEELTASVSKTEVERSAAYKNVQSEMRGLIALARETYGLPIEGVMAIPPADEAPGLHFALLAKIAGDHGLAQLSMGMSGDFETAIRFGATHVRVGSALFGERTAV